MTEDNTDSSNSADDALNDLIQDSVGTTPDNTSDKLDSSNTLE